MALREFPADALDEELIPGFMTFRMLHRHILESSHALTGLLLDGAQEFNKPETRAKFGNYLPVIPADASTEDLIEALQTKLEERATRIASQGNAFWEREVTHFSGTKMTAFDMFLMIQKHEAEHRAQAALLSRIKGIVPATTRRRLAAQAR